MGFLVSLFQQKKSFSHEDEPLMNFVRKHHMRCASLDAIGQKCAEVTLFLSPFFFNKWALSATEDHIFRADMYDHRSNHNVC